MWGINKDIHAYMYTTCVYLTVSMKENKEKTK